MTAALETRRLAKHFGGIIATNDVSLTVEHGARHALIGPNGAGKTTLINLLTGVLAPSQGSIHLEGKDITGIGRAARVKLGLARTFQVNSLFAEFTPFETLTMTIGERLGIGSQWWRKLRGRPEIEKEAEDLLETFHLVDVGDRPTKSMAYGKQRLLEIAIAFACKPKVMLLDEPAAGVPESESAEIFQALAALPPDVTVLLIEHDMHLVFRFADRITVMVNGAVFAQGAPDQIARDPRVRAVYLGEDA